MSEHDSVSSETGVEELPDQDTTESSLSTQYYHESVSSGQWDEEDADPDMKDQEEDGYDVATHGGGELEYVPGFDAEYALTEGLEDLDDCVDFEDEEFDLESLGTCCQEEYIQPESVCGRDDRVRIMNTTSLPWRMICVLIVKTANGGTSRCTGWFVGPHTVMTAGHCVYSHKAGGWAKQITVIPGMKDRRTRPYGSQTSTSFRSTNGWIKKKRSTEDYGCIILPNDTLGKRVGWFGVATLSAASLKNLLINNAGYPSDKTFGLWYNAGRIVGITATMLKYMIDTYNSQSGSPVFRRKNNKIHAVGIHAYGGCPNKAIRITKAVYQNILKWKK